MRDDPALDRPEFHVIIEDSPIAVFYTPYDLFSGLNRESNAYARGIVPEDALRIAIALITYAMSH